MELKTIMYKNKQIAYTIQGKEGGTTLTFLHGYLEYKELWSDFIESFKNSYRILCIDLPGHGQSDVISSIQTMSESAQIVKQILDRNNIDKTVLIGHSMGGYVSLAFADQFPNYLQALVLFSSSALSDSTEKKHLRNADIEAIQSGGKEAVIDSNIPKMFASENLIAFDFLIKDIKAKVKTMQNEAITSALEGMKQRVDYKLFLNQIIVPTLFIAGEHDRLIPVEMSKEQVKDSPNVQFERLAKSGHMGYIEEKEVSQALLQKFLSGHKI